MIKLFINGTEVDLTGEETILIQKVRTDFTNPTVVKNSFTKTVTLPGTNNNNKLFNHIWKLDRTQYTGAFNPSYRASFVLTDNGNLIESGYVKLDKIITANKDHSYECTLYGELGNLLYELSYSVNPDTGDTVPLTLGALDYQISESATGKLNLRISKDAVYNAWENLDVLDTTDSAWNTLNFAVCYDGIPTADNFDPKKMMVSTIGSDGLTRKAAVYWEGTNYPASNFPVEKTVDGVYYGYLNTMISRMDPSDNYALMELKNGITPIEARDFRSYLQRPILRLKKVFEAIGRYLNTNLGWTLDLSDPFFSSSEYTNAWITLSMLYEINPKVESRTQFTQEQLLSNTSSPASYLISYCKMYGIYIDPDIQSKTLKLLRLPRFFEDNIKDLLVDESQKLEITPLSFDKSAYTFDFADSEGEFIKKYKETYGIGFGSKRVNTGYKFDASVAPYIDNNIFKAAVDTIEQSGYYHYNYDNVSSPTNEFPIAVAAQTEYPEYKLFRVNQSSHNPIFNEDDTVDSYGSTMSPSSTLDSTLALPISWGYEYATDKWSGITKGAWQDTHARLQFHGEDNKSIDGKDVLVTYNGKVFGKAGKIVSNASTYDTVKSENDIVTDIVDATYGRGQIKYLISDDYFLVKQVIGTNCYFDNPIPGYAFGGGGYLTQINQLPLFNRAKINYASFLYNPYERHNLWNSASITISGSGSLSYGSQYFTFTHNSSAAYASVPFVNHTANHKYLIVSKMLANPGTGSYYLYLQNGTHLGTYKESAAGRVKDWEIVATKTSYSGSSTRIRTYKSTAGALSVAWITVIDLTVLGMDNLKAEEAFKYFKFDKYQNYGCPYFELETLDFGTPREIYVPATIVKPNSDIYNKYWSKYIADVYSVDTRVIKGKVYLENVQNAFRKFYYYDNTLWILSEVQDWNNDTKLCTAIFTKVNDKQNYLSD